MTYCTLISRETRVCLHEEDKRHCETETLVHTKKRGGGTGHRNMRRSSATSKNLLRLVETLPTAWLGRVNAEIQKTPHHPPNPKPSSERSDHNQTEDCLVSTQDSWISPHARNPSRTHDRLQDPTLLRPQQAPN